MLVGLPSSGDRDCWLGADKLPALRWEEEPCVQDGWSGLEMEACREWVSVGAHFSREVLSAFGSICSKSKFGSPVSAFPSALLITERSLRELGWRRNLEDKEFRVCLGQGVW